MLRTSIAEWREENIGDADGRHFDRLEPAFMSGLIDREEVTGVRANHDRWCAIFDFGECDCQPEVFVILADRRIQLDPAGRIAGSH